MPSKAAGTRTSARPLTASKRKSLATQQLLNTLAGDNQTAVVVAALEVVNEWATWDGALLERLRQKYEELSTLSNGKSKQPDQNHAPAPFPIAGKELGKFNPYGKLDPYELLDEYGRDQLRAVLTRATQRHLREALDIVQSHDPDTKPPSRSRNDAMIDFIVEKVAGPGY